MAIQPNETYVLNLLKELLDTPSPTGYTHDIMKRIEQEAATLDVSLEWNEKAAPFCPFPDKTATVRLV